MRVVFGVSHYQAVRRSVVTTGMFDGVHFGHRKLLEKIRAIALQDSLESIVLTVWPHPRSSQQDFKVLNTLQEKIKLLEQQGIDTLIVEKFDSWFSSLSPQQYIEQILHQCFKASKVVQGYDHRFGHRRSGDLQTLKDHSKQFGYELIEIEAQEIDSIAVSSTKIRQALEQGKFSVAKEYLQNAYPLSGTVGHGFKMGRSIGFPTANLTAIYAQKLIPKNGVYYAVIQIDKFYKALLNIGHRPTFGGQQMSVEAHVLGFEGDLYGQELTFWLKGFIREEVKFSTASELKAQIERDCQQVLALDDFV